MIRFFPRSTRAVAGALALTLGAVGCLEQPADSTQVRRDAISGDAPKNGLVSGDTPKNPQAVTLPNLGTINSGGVLKIPLDAPVRGVDPASVRAPLYLISMKVETDQTANPSSLVYQKNGDPTTGVDFSTFAPADKLRVGLEAVVNVNGTLVAGPTPVTCQVGTYRDGGDVPSDYWTTPGGVYSTCMKNPDNPAIAGLPIAFNAPVAVGAGDTLNLYTRLEVLNGGIVWAPASDPNAGVPGALKGLGAMFSALGDFLPGTPVGDAAHVVGTSLSLTGQFTTPDQNGVEEACFIAQSLIPGFSSTQAPSDNDSPLLRTQFNGRQLYEATSRGDAALTYDLDWRAYPQTAMCLKQRPHTKVTYFIRRVPMFGPPGAPSISQGGTIVGAEPDLLDAFAVDCNGQVVHDQRGTDASRPLAWEVGDAVPSTPLPPNAAISALSRTPGHLDLYAVSTSGNIVSTWRDKWADGNAWHPWFNITSGGKFPAGARLTTVSRNADHVDVFAVGNDGSIITTWWDAGVTNSWNNEFSVSPAGIAPAGAGLSALARNNDDIDVYVSAYGYRIGEAYWSGENGWNYASNISPLWVTPGSNLAAISRNSNHDDIFYVDSYGILQVLSWDSGTWATAPQQVLPTSMSLAVGAPISVVARKVNASGDPTIDNDHLDVFVLGGDGHILHAPWRYGDDNYLWNPTRAEELPATATSAGAIGAEATYAGTIEVAGRAHNASLTYTWYEQAELNVINWQLASLGDGDNTSVCGGSCCGTGDVCVAGGCCASYLACGNACCAGYNTCGGGGTAGVCGCTPAVCQAGECGTMPNGCGGTITCGGCGTGEVCSGNECISKRCVPRTCPKGSYWDSDDCICQKGLPQ